MTTATPEKKPNPESEVATEDHHAREPEVVTDELHVTQPEDLQEEVATQDTVKKPVTGKDEDKDEEKGEASDKKKPNEKASEEGEKKPKPGSAQARIAKAHARKEAVQKEINKAVAEQRAAERRLQEVRDRTQTLQQKIDAKAGGDSKAKPEDEAMEKAIGKCPKYDEFEDNDQGTSVDHYTDAKLAHEKKKEAYLKQAEVAKTAQEAQERFYARVAEVRSIGEALYPDYAEKVHGDKVPWTPGLAAAIVQRDDAAELLHHLAQDHNEIKRLAALSGPTLQQEIEKVSQSVAEATPNDDQDPDSDPEPGQPARKPASRAAPPITPIRGGGSNAGARKDPSTMSPEEYRVWRSAGGGR